MPTLLSNLNKSCHCLYTYPDFNNFLAKSCSFSLCISCHDTRVICKMMSTGYEFCGLLEIFHVDVNKIVPIKYPDPSKLILFCKANDVWPLIAQSLRDRKGLTSDALKLFDHFSFLTHNKMINIAQQFALSQLRHEDCIEVTSHSQSSLNHLRGEVEELNSDKIRVWLYSTKQSVWVERQALTQYFDSLDLVKVISGFHQGSHSVVLYAKGKVVHVLVEENASIISVLS